jgi:hypothetical protein
MFAAIAASSVPGLFGPVFFVIIQSTVPADEFMCPYSCGFHRR